jgi:hypothetical protein
MSDDQVRVGVGRRIVPAGDRRRRIRVELRRLVVDRLGIFDLSLLPQSEIDELLAQANTNVDRAIADEQAQVVGEFASRDAEIDPANAATHLRAESLLRQIGVGRPSERQYQLALVAARYGMTATAGDAALTDRLEGAEALSDLAQARLHDRGVRESDDDFESAYMAEIRKVEEESGLDYYDNAA